MAGVAPTLSYCVVNTNGREHLLACLAAIERTHPAGVEREILVLDNASEDGSAEAVRALGGEIRLIALERRAGKAENDSTLLREAKGRYCLLLNEDSELRPGAAAALIAALDADPRAARGGRRSCSTPRATRSPAPGASPASAPRSPAPSSCTACSPCRARAARPARVDWAQSSALMVRREAAAEVGYLDPAFFVYYDECDFCKRLADAGWRTLFVPAAEAVHHDQLSTDLAAGLPRIVEFHRNRDLYMRKHHGRAAALAVRCLTAWSYAVRAAGRDGPPRANRRRIYRAHARQALRPDRGESLRDRAEPG